MTAIRVIRVLYVNLNVRLRNTTIRFGHKVYPVHIRQCSGGGDVPRVSILTDTAREHLPLTQRIHSGAITIQPICGTDQHGITIVGLPFNELPRVGRLASDEDARLGTARL